MITVLWYVQDLLGDASNTLILALGNSSIANDLISAKELSELGSEVPPPFYSSQKHILTSKFQGYIIRAGVVKTLRVLAANGNPLKDAGSPVVSPDVVNPLLPHI